MIEWSHQYSNGAWVVNDYQTAKHILSSELFSCQRAGRWINTSAKDCPNDDLTVLKGLLRQSVVFMDGAKHQRIRSLLIQIIKKSVANQFEVKLTQIVDSTINSILNHPCDLISDLAKVVPAKSIAYLMGINPKRKDLYRWCDDIASFIGAPIECGSLALKAQSALNDMVHYFELAQFNGGHLQNEHRILESLVQEISQDSVRGKQILLAQLCTLLFGAYETTRNLIGNSLYLLLKHKHQFELLHQEPQLVDRCIREVLRFESPVQYTGRIAFQDIFLGDAAIRSGDLVIVDIASANRDPNIFSNPNTFNIMRKPIANLAFGHAHHYCLGATLSIMECRAVLRKLLGARIHSHSDPTWSSNTLYRGLDHLEAIITMNDLTPSSYKPSGEPPMRSLWSD
jgi:cytochrome P450